MSPISDDPQDQQVSGNIDPTDGGLSAQPPYNDDVQGSLRRDEAVSPNELDSATLVPKQETKLLKCLRDLAEKIEKSKYDVVSNRNSINFNAASEAPVDVPVETSVNTANDTAADATFNTIFNYSETPLRRELEETVENDVNIPSLEPPHQTPLHIAIRTGLDRIAKQLISAGADINALDGNGMQPLHVACEKGNENLIRLLLDKKATYKGPDRDGWCLLHCVSYYEMDAGVLDRLIELDREYLDRREKFEEWTPINRAAYFGRQSVVDALLKAGVNLGIADKNGWTPMMTAIEEKHFHIFDKMVDHLHEIGLADSAVSKGVIDQTDDEGMTVLMTLCVADPNPDSEASLQNFLQKLRPSTSITDNIDQTALDHVMAQAKTSKSYHARNMALAVIKSWPEQDLLRQNMANETPFDDAFDDLEYSGPLLKVLGNRLKANFALRDKLLCRLATRTERHPAAVYICSTLEPREQIDAQDYQDKWTLVDWAIYHRMPRVLMNCSAVDGMGTNHGTEIISELKTLYPPPDKKPNTDRKDELTPGEVLDEMGHILNFLPQMRSGKPKARWKVSRCTDAMSECLEDYNAAVVKFRQRELEALRFRKVEDIVYDDEPIKVITISQIEESAWGKEAAADAAKKDLLDAETTFTWVHLPAANMDWMKVRFARPSFPTQAQIKSKAKLIVAQNTVMKIMKTQSEKESGYQENLTSFLQASWVEVPDKTSGSRFMRPRYVRMQQEGSPVPDTNKTQDQNTARDDPASNSGGPRQGDGRPKSTDPLPCPATALYMPFLAVSKYDDRTHLRDQDEDASKRQNLFSAYEGSVLHDSPTLDEHYYHFAEDVASAEDRQSRNRTQVISKYLAPPNADERDMPKTILRVSQLWAWTIGERWLVTSTSCAKIEKGSDFVLKIREHLRRRKDDGSLNGGLRSPQELSKVIAEYCIGAYDRKQKLEAWKSERAEQNQPNLTPVHSQAPTRVEERPIRQVFSEFINEIGRKETDLFRQFSEQSDELDQKHSKAKNRSLTIEEVQVATRTAAKLLFQIKDVRDELHILKTMANYQEKVQNSMDEAIHSVSDTAFDDNMKAKYVKNDMEELDRLARNIQEALQTTLTLHESEIANRQAKEAVDQGKRVIIFTVVTVWFLPLSFLTSLFALDVESFLGAPWWSLVVILTVPLPFLLVAVGYMYDWDVRKFYHGKQEDETVQPFKSAANRAPNRSICTGSLRRRLARFTKKNNDQDGNNLV